MFGSIKTQSQENAAESSVSGWMANGWWRRKPGGTELKILETNAFSPGGKTNANEWAFALG